jgi:heptosyltransferase I
MTSSPKFLIIRLSSLGDILHALPAFEDLRKSFPNARIDWLVGENSAFLLSAVPGIHKVRQLDTKSLLRVRWNRSAWSQAFSLVRDLRTERYDCSIDFQGLLKTAFLGLCSGSRRRLGFSGDLVREPPAHWFYHRTLRKPDRPAHVRILNQMLAELAGAARSSFFPLPLVVPEADARHVDSLLQKNDLTDFVVINPGGGWPTKRWKPDRYGELAARIHTELSLPVVVTTGPGEGHFYEEIAAHSGKAAMHHFQISFIQLIHLLKKARLFVGCDTGPFHLACAVGTPVVGIFGPTSPVRNGPWNDGEEVVTRMLPCGPCHKRACTAKEDCMDIPVSEVFAAVKRRVQNTGGN